MVRKSCVQKLKMKIARSGVARSRSA